MLTILIVASVIQTLLLACFYAFIYNDYHK